MVDKRTIRDIITEAIVAGFASCDVSVMYRVGDDETGIYVQGYVEPIRVLPLDVIVPDEFGEVAAGIQLDVRAILSGLGERRG